MEIITQKSKLPRGIALILGFFDGIHLGHQRVISNTANVPKVIVTFSKSPAEYFGQEFDYIYYREHNYELMRNLGVDYVYEQDFSEIANLTAEEYLQKIIQLFCPISITTGFNHTFGAKRQGNSDFLEKHRVNYEYFCTPPTIIDDEIVSSTKIKEFISKGEIEKANKFLTRKFSLNSTVIEGAKLGRELGFPTANMMYPKSIVKLPYGVYKVKVMDKTAIMNWGCKPTIGADEILEVHIPNFEDNLYGKNLNIEILSKIRDEKKFNSLEELKNQIQEDVKECLK